MGIIIGLIIFGIPSAIIAGNKGFKPLRWLIAFGFIGLITVSCLSSAKKEGVSPGEARERAERADSIGAWLCGANLTLSFIFIIIAIGMDA